MSNDDFSYHAWITAVEYHPSYTAPMMKCRTNYFNHWSMNWLIALPLMTASCTCLRTESWLQHLQFSIALPIFVYDQSLLVLCTTFLITKRYLYCTMIVFIHSLLNALNKQLLLAQAHPTMLAFTSYIKCTNSP